MKDDRCAICGDTRDTATGLIWWKDLAYQAVDAAPRCKDREACRKRVELAGEDWPVLESHQRVAS